jgi:tRNA A37 threonylcarbamoyladenosine dehydratase
MTPFHRTQLLTGAAGLEKLLKARVLVVGIGGVGSHACEALARAPIGHLTLVDHDTIARSNINRQLHATVETLGQSKTAVMAERIRKINPEIDLIALHESFSADNAASLLDQPYDYVIDAIDTVEAKLLLLQECVSRQLPVVSSMGAARRLDPERIRIADISATRDCPLAKLIRKQLKKAGICKGITTVFSDEPPILPISDAGPAPPPSGPSNKAPIGAISYMPATFGYYCASVVIRSLLRDVRFKRRGIADAGGR